MHWALAVIPKAPTQAPPAQRPTPSWLRGGFELVNSVKALSKQESSKPSLPLLLIPEREPEDLKRSHLDRLVAMLHLEALEVR